MESVYKICVLGKASSVKEILVFSREPKEDQTDSPFSEKERAFIEAGNIPVRFIEQAIYKDDSIATLKYKILPQFEGRVSYHELYLFSHIQKNKIHAVLENMRGTIDLPEYKQLLVNLDVTYNELVQSPSAKQEYAVEDMKELADALQDESAFYKISIGKRFRSTHNELFSANPYDMLRPPLGKDICWIQSSANPLESFENQLLLNNNAANFIDNTIFACFAEDVLEFCEESGINQEWATSVYFPLLIKEDITNIEALHKNQKKLLSTTKKMTPKPNETIDILYDIYRKRTAELAYFNRGIDIFSCLLHPDFKHILPLDVIFKNVHSTKTIPFIKYNPGPRRENIYRLYSEQVTKYGTKIPFLPARTIMKLAKETGKNKQISFSVEHAKGDFYIQIFSNGDVSISGNNFRAPLPIDVLEGVIKEIANPVIDHINDFLKKNGYELNRFENLRESKVEIEYIHYVLKMKLQKEVELECAANSVFDITDADIYRGAKMNYKRVENYSVMNEEDAFIAGLFGHPRKEIIEMIAEKYEMEKEQAALRLVQFLRDHEENRPGQFVKSSVKISDSPGFPVTMSIESYEDVFVCDISLDNGVAEIKLEYIDAFSTYMDSILRITENPKSTGISAKKISSICAKKEKGSKGSKEIKKFDNIITGIEASILYDTIEEEAEVDEGTFGAFGDLDQYEDANVELDVIEEYEEAPEFDDIESLSMIEEPSENIENTENISMEKGESDESDDSDSNNLMYMPDEDVEEGENEVKDEVKGGASKLDGMVLKEGNDNIFLSKLKRRDPALFLSEDNGKFSAYSKICPAAVHRQPVILTAEEKAHIDAEDKKSGSKSYNHALEYGSDPDNKHFYICPRYWCLKTNTSISENDAKEGKKCGKIIPKGSNVVKPGHYVVEFNHPRQHLKKNGDYLENTPGFIEGKLHPDGACMPCCFKKEWDSEEQVKRRKKCFSGEKDIAEEEIKRGKKYTYIYDIHRYPIPQQRWGFLPISVQYFLQTNNSLAIDPHNSKYLRTDRTTTTLLRYGVEHSAKKSFIACIADLYAYRTQSAEVPTVENMCAIISTAVSIDLFLKYHNGSLASIFKPKSYYHESIDVNKYESSEFVKRLDQSNESHLDFIYDTIAAYENFQSFLTNPASYIDHTYLWDIVCSPNPRLFSNGCNLAILRIREVDMTDDIELLCPTSVYSPILFDVRKETIILIQHDEYFEPVYLFQSKIAGEQRAITIQKMFSEKKSPIKEVLQLIRNSIQKFCTPKSSMPTVYKFERSFPADTLRILLLDSKLTADAQVLNYKGKVVGFRLKYHDRGFFIPCYPSPQLPEMPILFMDDPSLFVSYKDTVAGLKTIYELSKGKIRSRPVFKILEDGQVIGVLTETNQFVMISEPVEPIKDGIPALKDENFVVVDKVFAQSQEEDPVRKNVISKIIIETQFYSAFRTTVRMLLNEPANVQYKQQIQKMVEGRNAKRDTIETLLHTMCDPFVAFKEFDEETLSQLGEISDCFLNPEEKKYCQITNGKAQIILPKYHLVSGRSNALLYFARVADELWRYKRIQLFMTNSKMYLNLTNAEYKINQNEMLMLESLLTQDYFKSLEPYQHGDTLITHETANPVITQKYSNELSLQQQRELVTKDTSQAELEDRLGIECIHITTPITGKITTSEWKRFFSPKAVEAVLHRTVKCSYYPIIYVYYELNRTFLTVEQIKSYLIEEYAKHPTAKILAILRKQGKRDMVDDINKGKYNLETAIMSEVYFLTPLDLWVLSLHLELPIILFHQKKLKNLIDTVNWLRLSDGNKGVYFFIRLPTPPDSASNFLPQYTIVKPTISATSPEIMALFANARIGSMISLYDYLDKFVR